MYEAPRVPVYVTKRENASLVHISDLPQTIDAMEWGLGALGSVTVLVTDIKEHRALCIQTRGELGDGPTLYFAGSIPA